MIIKNKTADVLRAKGLSKTDLQNLLTRAGDDMTLSYPIILELVNEKEIRRRMAIENICKVAYALNVPLCDLITIE